MFREFLSLEIAPSSNSHQIRQNAVLMMHIYTVLLLCAFPCLMV